jgi:hypothetical protein
MSKATLQSLKSKNAVIITQLHKDIKQRRVHAKHAFQHALRLLKLARKDTETVKKLARQQITIKRDLKGPAKPPRPVKADTRLAPANPKVGGAAIYQLPSTAVTGGAVSAVA